MPSKDTASYNPFGNNFLTRGNRFVLKFHFIRQFKCKRKLSVSIPFLRRSACEEDRARIYSQTRDHGFWELGPPTRQSEMGELIGRFETKFVFPNPKKRNDIIFLLLLIYNLSFLLFSFLFCFFFPELKFALGIFNLNSFFTDNYS